eukprot:scaffold2124_cov90-Isochrysis_galbana.AAC.1
MAGRLRPVLWEGRCAVEFCFVVKRASGAGSGACIELPPGAVGGKGRCAVECASCGAAGGRGAESAGVDAGGNACARSCSGGHGPAKKAGGGASPALPLKTALLDPNCV